MNKSDIPATPTGLEQPRERTGATRMRAVLGKILGWGFVAVQLLWGRSPRVVCFCGSQHRRRAAAGKRSDLRPSRPSEENLGSEARQVVS